MVKKHKTARTKRPPARRVRAAEFIPLALVLMAGTLLNSRFIKQRPGVLAYATSMSIQSLLDATNGQRTANGVAGLQINGKLNQAAQAKANDMVTRNYWSHTTPDGQEPWVFFDQAGYRYQKAGENLAYGFLTADDTVTGWMNSPGHRANLLNTGYLDVGFGFANSSDYVNNGQETVVVAEYGAVLGASAAAPASAPSSTSPVKKTAAAQPAATPLPTAVITPAPTAEPAPSKLAVDTNGTEPIAVAPGATTLAGKSTVRRIQLVTNGSAPWSTAVLSLSLLSVAGLWLLHHGFALRRSVLAGERFILHHLPLDLTVIALVGFGWMLLTRSGVVG